MVSRKATGPRKRVNSQSWLEVLPTISNCGRNSLSRVRKHSVPRERRQGITPQVQLRHHRPHLQHHEARRGGVAQNQDSLPIGILASHMINICQNALGIEAACTAANHAGKMSEGPVLPAACDFLSPRVDRDDSTAWKRADIRATL